jgi:hypothetical protein
MGKDNCPNIKSTAWTKLVELKGGNVDKAMNAFISCGYKVPKDEILAENVINYVGFKPTGLSRQALGKIYKKLGEYNDEHMTAHKLIDEIPDTNNKLVYTAKILINTNMGRKYAKYATSNEVVYSEHVDKDGNRFDVAYSDYGYGDKDVIMIGDIAFVNGKYWANNVEYDTLGEAQIEADKQMYQLLSSGYPKAIEGLDNALISFLSKYGITVNQIEDFKAKHGLDAIAVADLANKIIDVAKGEADALTLPEEASHFIIEMLGENHPLYLAMSKTVKSTPEYAQVIKEYGKLYKNNEAKLMKEAMGKILAKALKNEYDGANKSLVDRIIQWFKNLFKSAKNEQLLNAENNAYQEIAKGVLGGYLELDGSIPLPAEKYFEVKDGVTKLKNAIRDVTLLFESRANKISSEALHGEPEDMAEAYRGYINIIKDKIGSGDTVEAINSILDVLEQTELITIDDEIRIANEEGNVLDTRSVSDDIFTVNTYLAALREIDLALKENKDVLKKMNQYEDDEKNVSTRITTLRSRYNTVLAQLDEHRVDNTKKIIEELSIEYVGPDGKKVQFDVDELLNSKLGKMGYVGAVLTPAGSSSDEVLRMVQKMVMDIYMESTRKAEHNGRKLQMLQEKALVALKKHGLDMSAFQEKDTDGKKTGYMLTNDNWGAYIAAEEKMHQDILNAVNENRPEETKYKSYFDINKNELTKEEAAKNYSIWKAFDKAYRTNRDGVSYPKPPTNPEYMRIINLDPSIKAYYDEMKRIHLDTREKLPKYFNKSEVKFLLPQLRMDDMQIMSRKGDNLSEKLGIIKKRTADKFRILEDDLGYGDTSGRSIKGAGFETQKTLPIYFTRKLSDMSELTDDVTSMYAHFSEMAYNFEGLSKRMGDLNMLQISMASRRIYKSGEDRERGVDATAGASSKELEALNDFLNIHVFGEENKGLKIKIGDKEFNTSKAANQAMNIIRKNNLFMSLATILSGHVKSKIDSFLDAVTGLYITKESAMWAKKELAKATTNGDFRSDIFRHRKQSKVMAMMDYSGASGDLKKVWKRLDLDNPLKRFTADDFWFGAYEVMGFQPKAEYTLAVYDNYRLYNGKFVSKEQFIQANSDKDSKDNDAKWKSLQDKSLYNAYEMKDGLFSVKPEYKQYVTPQLENTIAGIVSHRTKFIEGNMGKFDKAGWSNNVVGQLLMMHRGWMIQGATERLKVGGVNYQTGMYEEGYYRTVGATIAQFFNHEKRKQMMSSAYWKNLQPYQKRNLMRSAFDVAFTVALTVLYEIIHSISEDSDEDDWGLNFAAYLSTRMLLEQGAFMNLKEIPNILNSPSAAFSFMDRVEDIGSILQLDFEEIKSGKYEGLKRWQKGVVKLSFLDAIYKNANPKENDKFVRNQIMGN